MLELIKAGGWLMIPIIICSITAVAICLERLWTLSHSRIAPSDLLAEVWGRLQENSLDADALRLLRRSSPLGMILAEGLSQSQSGRDLMK